MNNNLFVVTAYYSDWEWSREDLVGVYDSQEKADEAKKAYEADIELRRLEESPLTDEEKEIKAEDLVDSRFEIYMDYLKRKDKLRYFECINIQETQLNQKPEMLCDQT